MLARCLLSFALAAAAARAGAQELPAGTAHCLQLLEARGSDRTAADTPRRLGDVCPEVAARLAAGPWGRELLGGPADRLTARRLQELVQLADHYAGATSAPNLAPRDLAAAVARLGPFARRPPPASLWDRLLHRLADWFDASPGSMRLSKWLRAVKLPAWSALVVAALVVLLAVAVIVNKLRHGGFLRRAARRRRAVQPGLEESAAQHGASSSDDVRSADPARLFVRVLRKLQRRYDGLVRDSGTPREIVAAAVARGLSSAAPLGALASAAETATYSDRAPKPAQLAAALAAGERLLGEFDAAPEGDAP